MNNLVFLSLPGFRPSDLDQMPRLSALMANGDRQPLSASFPAVTWPVQANMLTGCRPNQHGVVANGFYWRESHEVEMWTASNEKILAPQVWDLAHQDSAEIKSAVWFPMLSKECGADYICMPAPVHNPDGSESLWCYTRPTEYYGDLLDVLGHFPLKNFWGPLSSIDSSEWIARSAVLAATRFQPEFFFLYLPHLDYAAQKCGPESPEAGQAVKELDLVIGKLVDGLEAAYDGSNLTWLAASEYVITEVDHVVYPNRLLRDAGLLSVRVEDGREYLDLVESRAWALVDHQFAHVFVRDADPVAIDRVVQLFAQQKGIAEVLAGTRRANRAMDHDRAGDVILISSPHSWQAYYWWNDDDRAPDFARTVDIHRKPGYDPVELHLDMVHRGVPLDASLVRGSHGAPVQSQSQCGIVLSSRREVLGEKPLADVDMAGVMLRQLEVPRGA
ncbi:MAG: alkaline phosphatase family protein [Planctomycetota bacterium]|nr:alkaline phosphatase family protein [Planctomycetota bacterium]